MSVSDTAREAVLFDLIQLKASIQRLEYFLDPVFERDRCSESERLRILNQIQDGKALMVSVEQKLAEYDRLKNKND